MRISQTRWAVLAVVAGMVTVGAPTTAVAAPADTYPWRGMKLCAKSAPLLRAAFTVTGKEFAYRLRAPRSRALGFVAETWNVRGGQIGSSGTNVIAGDAFDGSLPRIDPGEVRFTVVGAAVFGQGRARCRVGVIRDFRLGGRPRVLRCDPKGIRQDRRLGCRVR